MRRSRRKKKRSKRRVNGSAESCPREEIGKGDESARAARLAEEIAGLKRIYGLRSLILVLAPILAWVKLMLVLTGVAILVAVLAGVPLGRNGILLKIVVVAATIVVFIPPVCVLYLLVRGRREIGQKTAKLRMLERGMESAGLLERSRMSTEV